jgi:hypothetical protein
VIGEPRGNRRGSGFAAATPDLVRIRRRWRPWPRPSTGSEARNTTRSFAARHLGTPAPRPGGATSRAVAGSGPATRVHEISSGINLQATRSNQA